MMLKNWELAHTPTEAAPGRWRLKLRIAEQDLPGFVAMVPGMLGMPFLAEDGEFDFGYYLNDPGTEALDRLKQVLEEACPGGKVFDSSGAPAVPAPTAGSLDDALAQMARGLESMQIPAMESAVPAVAPASPAAQPAAPVHREVPAPPAPEQPAVVTPAETAPADIDSDLNPGYTFQEFIVGPSNRFTAAAAQAVADNPGRIYNPFFIYGGVGLGKTHLMEAVGHYVKDKNPALRVLYRSTEKFMSEVIDAIRGGTTTRMREFYRTIDLLLIDDIQFLADSESTQEEFFHIFNTLHQSGRQIIMTSDRPPKQLTTLEDRLRSRFEWGLIADIKSPNLETRVAILKKKGENEHLVLADNILLYIASKLKSNIRELEGFLKRINAYAALTHQEVNMELAESLMQDLLPVEERDEKAAPAQQPAGPAAQASPAPQHPVSPPVPPPVPPPLPRPVAPSRPPVMPPVVTVCPPSPAPVAPPSPRPPVPAAPDAAGQPVAPPPEASELGLKPVEVVFFFPEGKIEELAKVKERFREVIRKHRLKFRLEGVAERPYAAGPQVDYASFPEFCAASKAAIAIVLGPQPDSGITADEFNSVLSPLMDERNVSLQYVPWTELTKDYRYLNLALDITLLKQA